MFNRTGSVTDAFIAESGDLREALVPTKTYEELVAALETPRAVIIMVKAGGPVDAVIEGAPIAERSKEIKAATFAGLEIRRGERGFETKVVFDV